MAAQLHHNCNLLGVVGVGFLRVLAVAVSCCPTQRIMLCGTIEEAPKQ